MYILKRFKCHRNIKLTSIVLISFLLIFSSCRNIIDNRLFRRRSLKKAEQWAKEDSIRVADSLKRTLTIGDLTEGSIQDSLDFPEDEWLIGEGTKNQYCIIVGSYTEAENAVQVAEQFKSRGYQPSIVTRKNSHRITFFMVSLKNFNDLEEAEKYKNEVQSQVLSSAWLYNNE